MARAPGGSSSSTRASTRTRAGCTPRPPSTMSTSSPRRSCGAAAAGPIATARESRPVAAQRRPAYRRRRRQHGRAALHHLAHASRPDRRDEGRALDRDRADVATGPGARAELAADQGDRSRRLHRGRRAQGELVERHAVRRRQRRDRVPDAAVHAGARRPLRLYPPRRRQRPRDRLARAARARQPAERRQPADRLGAQHQRLAVERGGAGQSQGGRLPALHGPGRRQCARRSMPTCC